MQRAPSPYRSPSPLPHPSDAPYAGLPTGPAQVGPGSITYTTSTGSDGRIIYHPFRAVAASYQTPSGIVSGIQWIPAEATTHVPPGAFPSAPGSGQPGGFAHKEEHKVTQEWQRVDEKKRKQEEKEAKRAREGLSRNDSDYELQRARERDAQSMAGRERRKSFVSGTGPSVAFAPSTNGGYHPPSPYNPPAAMPGGYASSGHSSGQGSVHGRTTSVGGYDIARQMSDMALGGKGEQERKASGHSRKYSTNDAPYERSRTVSGGLNNPYPSPPSTYPKGPYGASPNMRPGEIPYGAASSTGYPSSPSHPASDITRSTTPFGPPPGGYPPGHVLYDPQASGAVPVAPRSRGPSRPVSRAGSRAPSPNPVASFSAYASPHIGKSPRMPMAQIPQEQLPAPEAFSRPINAANSFAPFDQLRILEMDDVYDGKPPRLPAVLTTHDIIPEDWNRCMQDLARSWTGQLPVAGNGPDGHPPKRSKLAQDLVELWNTSFFSPRGVEMVLYKGNERRTGSLAGQRDPGLFGDDSDSSSSTTTSSEDQSDDDLRPGPYGRPPIGTTAAVAEARRRRREEKFEKRQRRKEKKARRKAKARSRTYTVFIACVSRGPLSFGMTSPPNAGYAPVTVPFPAPAGYPSPAVVYGAIPPGTYPSPMPAYTSPTYAPVVMPTARSGHGYGY